MNTTRRGGTRRKSTSATVTAIAAPSSLFVELQQHPSSIIMKKPKKQPQQQQSYHRVSSSSSSSSLAKTSSAAAPLSTSSSPAQAPLSLSAAISAVGVAAPLPSISSSSGGGIDDFTSKNSIINVTRRGGSASNSCRRLADPQKTYILRVKGMSTGIRRNSPYITPLSGSTGVGFVLFEANDDGSIHNATNTTTTSPEILSLEDCWIASSLYLQGRRSVFEAAYTAIVVGLQHAVMHRQVQNIILQIDHDVICKQLIGEFKVQRESLVPMYWKIMQFKESFYFQSSETGEGSSTFTIQYIAPQHNELAKNLSTLAIGTKTSQTLLWAQPDFESNSSNDENANADPMMMQLLMANVSTSAAQNQTIAAASAQTRDNHTFTTAVVGQTKEHQETLNSTKRETESDVYNVEEQGGTGGLYNDGGASSTIAIDPSQTYLLQFDGGARRNPGFAGGGMVLYDSAQEQQELAQEVWCGWEFFGKYISNNQAEYQSLIRGLQAARALGIRHLIVQGDSELIVKQLHGIYAVKNSNLRLYFAQVQALIRTFETFQIGHIRRAQNARADALANHAMDHQGSHHGLLPSSSFHENVEVPPVLPKQQEPQLLDSATRSEKNKTIAPVAIKKRQMSSFAALSLEEDVSSGKNGFGDWDMSLLSSTLLDHLMNPSVTYVFHRPEQPLPYDVPELYNDQTARDDGNDVAMREETSRISIGTRDATFVNKVLSPPNSVNVDGNESSNVTETKPSPPSLAVVPAHVINNSMAHVMSSASDTITTAASLEIDPSKKYRLQFDGGSRGNPGLAGAGMVLYDDDTGKEIWCGCKYLGKDMTSNQAEYSSLLLGLEAAQSLGIHQLIVEGDSELIVRQINGTYKVRNAKLREYFEAVQERIQKLDSFQIQQIPRAKNARADELANQAMGTLQSASGLQDPLSFLPRQRQRCT
jgi:ribonuclease HI